MTKRAYFIAATECFAQVMDPSLWVKTNATSLDGAKRLATKQARSTTFTARVAIENATGQFETLATLNNSFAITRRRPMWRVHTSQGVLQNHLSQIDNETTAIAEEDQTVRLALLEAGYTVHPANDATQGWAYCVDGEYSPEFPTENSAWDAAGMDFESQKQIEVEREKG